MFMYWQVQRHASNLCIQQQQGKRTGSLCGLDGQRGSGFSGGTFGRAKQTVRQLQAAWLLCLEAQGLLASMEESQGVVEQDKRAV